MDCAGPTKNLKAWVEYTINNDGTSIEVKFMEKDQFKEGQFITESLIINHHELVYSNVISKKWIQTCQM